MKPIYLLSLILLVAGCSHDEPLDDFDQFDDYAQFSLNGKGIKLTKWGYSNRGVVPILDEKEKIDSVKIVVGSGVNRDGLGELQLNFSIIKTFLAEDLGINPDAYDNSEIEIMHEHLHAIFSEPGDVVKGFVSGIFSKSEDGVSMLFYLEGEYYTAIPKIEIDNQEKQSVFRFKRSKSSTSNHIKVEYLFDVYMKGQSSGNIIHLENGKFIASYRWEEF